MKRNYIALLMLLSFFIKVQSQNFPDNQWEYDENFQENGWKIEKLQELQRFIVDSSHVTGFMIINNGKIVFEYGNTEDNSYIASCRKSILAILYGKHVKNGKINLEATLDDLKIEDVTPLLPIEKTAKVKDLLASRSGVFLNGSNPGSWSRYYRERGSVKPGDYWIYNNWDFNLAGFIFEKLTSKDIYDEVENQLAIPLKMEDWDKSIQRKFGNTTISKYPAYHMWFSTRDMARIGLLMLNKGKWKDKQIIDENWIDNMLKFYTTNDELIKNVPTFKDAIINLGYGYMWWLWDDNNVKTKGAFSALGAMGQSITVFPKINTVVVFKTNARFGRSNSSDITFKLLKKSVDSYIDNH
ncbi:MAG: serine hydrolase [Flavobacteriaceae bacterium]|nr:serine hydrolase [Flavobacteriaceae bacterium]